MFNWIHKLLGRPPAHPQPAEQVPQAVTSSIKDSDPSRPPAPARVTEPAQARVGQPGSPQPDGLNLLLPAADFNVQTAATRWVFSLDDPLSGDARSRLTLTALADAVERLSLDTTRAADWVPRVPMVLPGLLKSLRNEHSSAQDLAALIEQDVTLLAEALKEANSAIYQRGETITQTTDVVRLLGNQGLRMLVARVAFRPVLGSDAGPLVQAGASRVWAIGDACAQASRDLAPARGVDPFEAFLSGLALNIGQLVALRMADRVAHLARQDAHGLGPRKVPVGELSDTLNDNQAAQDVAHMVALLSHRVAARWELPDNVVGVLTAQIDPVARIEWPQAADLLAVAQEAARLKSLHEAGQLPATLAECSHHLPDDARQWLLHACQSTQEDGEQSTDNNDFR